jgi:hypothetical protein
MLVLNGEMETQFPPCQRIEKENPATWRGHLRAGFLTWREVFDVTHPKRSEDTQHEEASGVTSSLG